MCEHKWIEQEGEPPRDVCFHCGVDRDDVEEDEISKCFFCSVKPTDEEWWPYCGPECALDAETDSAGTGIVMGEVLGPAWESLKFQRRGCWHQNGQPKIRHKTESAAWEHARELVARGAHRDLDRLRVYRCHHCDQWHVGHVGGV